MRHDPLHPQSCEVSWSVASAGRAFKLAPPNKVGASPDRLVIGFAVLTFLLSLGATWSMLLTDWLYFPWIWMTAAGVSCVVMGLTGYRPGASFPISLGPARAPLIVDHGGLLFVFSGALWLVLLRSFPKMAPDPNLAGAAAASSCAWGLGIVVACLPLSKAIRLGAGAHSALVAWGLVSIGAGHIRSIPALVVACALLALAAWSEFRDRVRR
jgi:hypothetical protein